MDIGKEWEKYRVASINKAYIEVLKERDYLRLQLEQMQKYITFSENRIAGLKGYIGRLKKK